MGVMSMVFYNKPREDFIFLQITDNYETKIYANSQNSSLWRISHIYDCTQYCRFLVPHLSVNSAEGWG